MGQIDCIVRFHDISRVMELNRCLFSLIGQKYRPLHIIIVLQRFSRSEIAIVQESLGIFSDLYDVPHFTVVNCEIDYKEDVRTELLNLGLSQLSGQYVAFLDYDDVLYPEAYSLLIDQLDSSHSAMAFASVRVVHAKVTPNFVMASHANSESFKGNGLIDLYVNNFCPLHSYVINRAMVSDELYFDTLLNWEEDYDLLLRLTAKYPAGFELLGVVLGDYYIKSDNSNSVGVSGLNGTLSEERLLEYESVSALIEARRRITRVSKIVQEQLGFQAYDPDLTIRSALKRLNIDEIVF